MHLGPSTGSGRQDRRYDEDGTAPWGGTGAGPWWRRGRVSRRTRTGKRGGVELRARCIRVRFDGGHRDGRHPGRSRDGWEQGAATGRHGRHRFCSRVRRGTRHSAPQGPRTKVRRASGAGTRAVHQGAEGTLTGTRGPAVAHRSSASHLPRSALAVGTLRLLTAARTPTDCHYPPAGRPRPACHHPRDLGTQRLA